eukprot:1020319-Prorocentrum_lima.AAC.1
MRRRFGLHGKHRQGTLFLRLPDPVAFGLSVGRWTSVAVVQGRQHDRVLLRPGWSAWDASDVLRAVRPTTLPRNAKQPCPEMDLHTK